jgi:hypothetical protein
MRYRYGGGSGAYWCSMRMWINTVRHTKHQTTANAPHFCGFACCALLSYLARGVAEQTRPAARWRPPTPARPLPPRSTRQRQDASPPAPSCPAATHPPDPRPDPPMYDRATDAPAHPPFPPHTLHLTPASPSLLLMPSSRRLAAPSTSLLSTHQLQHPPPPTPNPSGVVRYRGVPDCRVVEIRG